MKQYIISLLIVSLAIAQTFDVNNSDLKMIVTLHRHGARIPSSNALNLKDKAPNSGELSVVGQRQLFYLGQILKKEYIDGAKLLSAKYDASEIYYRSTDFNRTIMSAQCLLAGLYPAQSGDQIPDDILTNRQDLLNINFKLRDSSTVPQITEKYPVQNGYQSIPIHVVERPRDKILLGYGDTCPQEEIWNPENQKSDEWKRITQEFQPQINKFAKIFNLDVSTLDLFTVYNYMDIIIAQQYQNMPLPADYTNDAQLQEDMEVLYNLRIHLSLYKTPLQKKTTVTPFLNNLVQVLSDKVSNPKNNQKGYFLSAHDTTVNMVLQGLNLTSWECIEQTYMKTLPAGTFCNYKPTRYGANLIVELRQDKTSSKNFIMIRYNGEYQKICDQTTQYCDLDEFKNRVANFVVPNYDEICGLTSTTSSNEKSAYSSSNYLKYSIIAVIISAFLL
ncbi:histidine phosphatase family (branch 2) protein (macronuclear) [Tetrahymena thermophila SB210]|uniref:Histidine phosphatase family (Branch 2) protein n=1 Tax=Tetrahymena thermophila (strain SB210) TaxID=312017 RepID=Q22P31_TETTS|nr:histidine phosphatase family (branch 2) protein [Tetrahymena thermophila SB210]EAR86980.1 histidine phosphatase family (branch 2) protein [Tetrahymena thermophila SB210]|eukprot:XP_001007225.1 histidine phosphatase family (branch 2) protein [Tetrahymena thermophila SB210]